MTTRPSSRPSLDPYRKQAKQLVRDVRAGEGAALERIRPQLRHIVSLADSQLVIAREQGFQSWAAFQQSVGRGAHDRTEAPSTPALAQLAELLSPDLPGDPFGWPRRLSDGLRAALRRGDVSAAAGDASGLEWALRKIATGHSIDPAGRTGRSTEADSQVADRAVRAAELLSSAIREEGLDLSMVRCSFCLKGNHEVEKLIRGSRGYICDVCTSAAVDVLRRHAG